MAAYLWLLALPALLALGRQAGPRWERWALLLAWIALTLFVGLRREVGADWDNYLLMHARAGAHPPAEAATLGDPAYMLVSGALFHLGFGLPAVNLLCAAIFAAGLLMLVRAQPAPGLALLIAMPVLIAIAAFATRQSAALGLLMAALACYGSGRERPAVLALAAAPAFHWTAIVLLPIVPAMLIKRIPVPAIVGAGAAAGLGLAGLLALTQLGARFDHVGESMGAMHRGGLSLIALIVAAAAWRRLGLGEREGRAAACLAALALFALALVPVLSTAGDRIGLYAVPLQMIVLGRAAQPFSSPALRRAVQATVGLLYAGLFAAWLTLSPYRSCLMPYRSYLADPSAIRERDPEAHRRASTCGGRGRASGQSRSTSPERTLG